MTEQRNEQWHQDRCGNITGSRLSDAMALKAAVWKVIRPTGTTLKCFESEQEAIEAMDQANEKKPGFSLDYVPPEPLKAHRDYVAELVCERLTGEPQLIPETFHMRWGKDHEPYAIQAYEARHGVMVIETGFVKASPETGLTRFGASPDGLVGMDGAVEVKCPVNSVNHLACFVEGIPEGHWPQLEGQLLALGRSWVDFLSFDPRFHGPNEHLQLYVERYTSKPELRSQILDAIAFTESSIKQFIAKLPAAPKKDDKK